MNKSARIIIFLLRISLGTVFLYAGIAKILNPEWSAAGYLGHAATFSGLYSFLLEPSHLHIVNFLNEWGVAALGAALILGLWVRLVAPLGALVMLLYYFPVLSFPYAGENSFIVDEHIVYALSLLLLSALRAGRAIGLDGWIASRRR